MDNHIEIPINKPALNKRIGVWSYFKKSIITERFNTPIGIFLLLAIAALVGYSVPVYGFLPSVFVIIIFIAIPFIYSIIVYPQFGVSIVMLSAYLLMWVIKWGIGFPIGTLMDGMEVLMIMGLLLKIKYNPPGDIYKNPITYLIIAWILYNVLEVANPAVESRLSWLYTIRSVAMVMLMYFVFTYHIRTEQFLKFIIKLWLALSVFAALYALWQEYIGFLPFEQSGLDNPDVRSLLLIDGHWRKFSIFADPVTFSYNMVASSLLCIGLITSNLSKNKKFILGIMALLFIYVMLFSGTRSAYILPPISLALLAILKMNKAMFIAAITGVLLFMALIFMPTSNYTLYRFQTAFKPSNDASYNVRKANQKRIQPYILTHPFGGGLGSTGAWGQRFAPNSYLAVFPPDSGYWRVAVELGWVGLFLFCTLMFTVLKTAVNNYYRVKDPFFKSVSLAMLLIVFAFNIGDYPQEAFVQFPTSIYLYLIIALINVVMRLDTQKQKLISQ